MPIFRCCWCQTRSEHPQAGVLVVCPECGVKFNAIDWGAKEASMTHDFKRGDKVLIKSLDVEARIVEPLRNTVTCEYYDEQDKLHTIFCSPAAIVHAAKPSPEEPMNHQFAIGDIVRLNGNSQEAEVIGFKVEEGSTCLLLQVKFTVSKDKMYFPENSVVLVRSGGAAPTDHPYKTVGPVGPHKIETTATARDATSLRGLGLKTHQRIED